MARLIGGKRSIRRRVSLALAVLSVAALTAVTIGSSSAFAALNKTAFELDKDAQNDITYAHLGVLNSNVTAAATSIVVCQGVASNPANGTKILIDSERMTVGNVTNANGGGCTGAFKRTYPVTRHVDGTTATSHAGGEDVSKLIAGSVSGLDWDTVVNDSTPKCTDIGLAACAYVHDGEGASIFTTGGSKDDLNIPSWRWTDGSVPDADELLDGMAAKYVNGTDQNLYFGADRLATNGAKDMGFWFFHSPVSLCHGTETTGDCAGKAAGTFSGVHTAPSPGLNGVYCSGSPQQGSNPLCTPHDADDTAGDILILSTFTQGGATTTVRIFEWVGTGGTATNAGTVGGPVGAFGDCVPGNNTDNGCATVNNTTIESPWVFVAKGEADPPPPQPPKGEIPSGGFLEGGIDLTALGLQGCFSNFLAETRSAPSVDATLKDFILGNFEACGATLTTTPANSTGNVLTDSNSNGLPDVQIGTSGVDVTDSAQLDVTGTNSWHGTLDFFLCGPIGSPNTCTTGGVHVNSSTINVDQDTTMPVTSPSAHVTYAGRYCWRGVFTSGTLGVDSKTDSTVGECFEVLPVTPTLNTTAVEASVGLSPTIYGGLADVDGSGTATTADDANAFFADTSIINGGLDCNAWGATVNAGTAGNGVIDGNDDCTLLAYDGTADGLTINVIDGSFVSTDPDGAGGNPAVAIADGTQLPTVYPQVGTPNDPSPTNAKFAWFTIFGRVDSNGNGTLDPNDCAFGVAGANILGSNNAGCGNGQSVLAGFNGGIDLNGDFKITSADTCTGCFFGRNVANGLVKTGTVDFGGPLYDVAVLNGTVNEPGSGGPSATYPTINPATPGGAADSSISFNLVGPGDCATAVALRSATVSGDGFYATSPAVTQGSGVGQYNAPGDYHWKASYPGDSPNTLAAADVGCPVSSETVTVRQIPTQIQTKQSWYPNDFATITSGIALDNLPNGTVDFYLVNNATCARGTNDANLKYAERISKTGGTHTYDASTSNYPGGAGTLPPSVNASFGSWHAFAVTSAFADAADSTAGPYSWLVVYTPSDTAHVGRQSACTTGSTEKFTITYTNDNGPGTST